ncbi:betaine--homocysteine S-methyltransferase 1-like [Haliotis asinina]|uniref:betaine--homocysteine S-methyltransferase 1-like n=1 Tax=Haliotis asinina TaxID=109174 RepID=UPI0035318228
MSKQGLVERLANGGDLIVAEGYLFEFERRGYLKAGAFVPEVVLEHPNLVKNLHEEFVHAGSDVVLAFTYYGHREKMRLTGREDQLEALNLEALKIARQVADETGTLMAGNICNTTVFRRDSQTHIEQTEAMFKEQVEWAVQGGADFILAETFSEYPEARLALECIQKYGQGIPAVVNIVPHVSSTTFDGQTFGAACRKLEEAGAAVVGVNCCRGPTTIIPVVKEIRQACKGPIAALPVLYRTTPKFPSMQSLLDPFSGKQAFPYDLPAFFCGRSEVYAFGKEAKEIGVQVAGLCCGNSAHYTRELALAYGRTPPAAKYSPDMSQHFVFGKNKSFSDYYQKGLKQELLTTEVPK